MSELKQDEVLNEEIEKTESCCESSKECCEGKEEQKEESLEDVIARLEDELKQSEDKLLIVSSIPSFSFGSNSSALKFAFAEFKAISKVSRGVNRSFANFSLA